MSVVYFAMIVALQTTRLILNAFTLEDFREVEQLAGDEAVARTTANVPHPYPPGSSKVWIASHLLAFVSGKGVTFAVRKKEGTLVGCVSVGVNTEDQRGDLAYWMGVPYWNQGFATEAGRECMMFSFNHFNLAKITSCYFATNVASGRVMEKLGMQREGYLRCHMMKNGVLHDLIEYGILKDECQKQPR